MRAPILYLINRAIVQMGVRAYFREIEVTGRDRMPPTGPVIIASNHPHSITDSLVLGLAADRMLHFIAHSGLFGNRLQAWFMRNSGVIPVHRPRDVENAADKNLDMFSACFDILDRGEAIGIFPEGTSAEERRVQKLKTGTARIALGAEERAQGKLGLLLVPVGLNFESRSRFRSRVLVKFGQPIRVAQQLPDYRRDPVATVKQLTEKLQHELRREIVNIEESEYESFVLGVRKLFKEDLLERTELDIPGNTPYQRDQALTAEIARGLSHLNENYPDVVLQLARQMKGYNTKRHLLKLRDDMLRRDRGPLLRRELWRLVLVGIAGLPWAMFGLLGNGLPYLLTASLAQRLAPDRTKVHMYQFGLGGLLFSLTYGVILTFAWRMWGPLFTGLTAVGLPLAGLFAREYFRYMKKRRRMLRFVFLELMVGVRVQELRLERRLLVRSLDQALQLYLVPEEEQG